MPTFELVESFDAYAATGGSGNASSISCAWAGGIKYDNMAWGAGRYGEGQAYHAIDYDTNGVGNYRALFGADLRADAATVQYSQGTLSFDFKTSLVTGGTAAGPIFMHLSRTAPVKYSTDANRFGMRVLGNGTLQIGRSVRGDFTAVAATAAGAILSDTWQRVELEFVSSGASSSVLRLYIDDAKVIDVTGINLRGSYADDYVQYIRIGNGYASAANPDWYMDNLLFSAESTLVRPGAARIRAIKPTKSGPLETGTVIGSNEQWHVGVNTSIINSTTVLAQTAYSGMMPMGGSTKYVRLMDSASMFTVGFDNPGITKPIAQISARSSIYANSTLNDAYFQFRKGTSLLSQRLWTSTANATSRDGDKSSIINYSVNPLTGAAWTSADIADIKLRALSDASSWVAGSSPTVLFFGVWLEVVELPELPTQVVSPTYVSEPEAIYKIQAYSIPDAPMDWEDFGPWKLASVWNHILPTYVDEAEVVYPLDAYNDGEIYLSYVGAGIEVFPLYAKANIPPATTLEWNPYRPDVPRELAETDPALYEYLREQAEITREQHEATQAGDTTFPWQMIATQGTTKTQTLGSLTRFFHETYGLMQGRYIEYSRHWSGAHQHPWVGHDSTKQSDWMAIDGGQRTMSPRVIGWSGPYDTNLANKFGWALTQGRGPEDITIVADTRPVAGKRFTWDPSDPSVGVIGPGPAVGMILTMANAAANGTPRNGRFAWTIPAGDWYIDVEGVTDEYIATATTGSLDDIRARLDAVEAAAGLDDGGLDDAIAALAQSVTNLQTGLSQESNTRANADTGIHGQITDLSARVDLLTGLGSGDYSAIFARIEGVESNVTTLTGRVTAAAARLDDLDGWRATASLEIDNALTAIANTGVLTLVDTPSSYIGSAGQALVVNATEDGMEFAPAGDGWTQLKLPASVTNASTTRTNLWNLAPAVFADQDSWYEIEVVLVLSSEATNGRVEVVSPAGAVSGAGRIIVPLASSYTANQVQSIGFGATVVTTRSLADFVASGNSFKLCSIKVVFKTPLAALTTGFIVGIVQNSGTKQLAANSGSYLRYRKIV